MKPSDEIHGVKEFFDTKGNVVFAVWIRNILWKTFRSREEAEKKFKKLS